MTMLRSWKKVFAAFLFCSATAIAAPAQTFTTLVDFDWTTNGAFPGYEVLAQGADGNLYGTTAGGGNTICGSTYGCGTLFGVTTRGTLAILYDFCVQATCADGYTPAS